MRGSSTSRAVLCAFALAACGRAPAPPADVPLVVTDASVDAEPTVVDAHGVTADDAGARDSGANAEPPLLLGPFAWPPGGTSKLVRVASDESQLVYSARGKTDQLSIPRIGSELHVTSHVVRDVDGDGTSELVVFLDPATTSAPDLSVFRAKYTLLAFGLDAQGTPRRLPLLEYRLIGVTDERSLETEISRLRRPGPIDGVAQERVLVRLSLATPDEVRRVVGPRGIDLCEHIEGHSKHCIHRAPEAIDAALARSIVGCAGPFDPYFTDDPALLELPICYEDGEAKGRILCSANAHSQEGGTWTFAKLRDGFRLIEVTSFFAGTGAVERGICSSAPPKGAPRVPRP